MRSRLSPTFVWNMQSMPLAASCSPIHDELVSTIWPSSSSVPTATTSQRQAHRAGTTPVGGAEEPDRRARQQVLGAGDDRQDHRQPEERVPQPGGVGQRRGSNAKPTASCWHTRLDLGQALGRDADALAAGHSAVHADGDLAQRDDRAPAPPEHVVRDEREHRAEHEHLVGQRVEERARAGGAVAPGEVAVDAVGDAQDDPERPAPATTPSSPSIMANRTATTSRRATVTALAGVARATGRTTSPCSAALTAASRSGPSRRRRPGTVCERCRPASEVVGHGRRCRRSRAPRGGCGPRRARRRAPRSSCRSARHVWPR